MIARGNHRQRLSLNNAGTSENLDFKPFFEVASAF